MIASCRCVQASLVINLNGTIEFILDDNDKDVTNNDIVKLLDKCNEFILTT